MRASKGYLFEPLLGDESLCDGNEVIHVDDLFQYLVNQGVFRRGIGLLHANGCM